MLRAAGTTSALVVPCATSRRLCDLGLMKAHGQNGSFTGITAAGLRALADAVDAGKIDLFIMPKRKGMTS
ncbi:hypothetical protein GR217_34245 [Rhizobium leguminosarum]|uniref:Uncharacterized protein n=1 Tax=Rhizobium ruizarguesonis TaxID=2081791 RepID=A0AAE4YX88_9HYPH|nr:hypothetical protein [Rhizobium ruizarguesonis]NEI52681.1 hypothetical protein [Rhizobium ruizarguesonis]